MVSNTIGPVLPLGLIVAYIASGHSAGGTIASASGVAAAVITILFPWPQLFRICLRSAAGVSGPLVHDVLRISGWALYGIEHGDRISRSVQHHASLSLWCALHYSSVWRLPPNMCVLDDGNRLELLRWRLAARLDPRSLCLGRLCSSVGLLCLRFCPPESQSASLRQP